MSPIAEATLTEAIRARLSKRFPTKKEIVPVGSPVHGKALEYYLFRCEKLKIAPDLSGFLQWSTSFKSRAGNYAEQVIYALAEGVKGKDSPLINYYTGKDLEAAIRAARKEVSVIEDGQPERLHEAVDRVATQFKSNHSPIKRLIKDHTTKLSFPDGIAILKGRNGTVRVRLYEAKLSGQLDVKNLPANIIALNRAAELWDRVSTTTIVEKAIGLTATPVSEKGEMRMMVPWERAISKNPDYKNISILGNEEVLTWITGIEFTKEQHENLVVNETARFVAERMYEILHL